MFIRLIRTSLFGLLTASALVGCATARFDTPTGFAAHEDKRNYTMRVSDGEGVVLAVRTEKNEPQGDLQYWTRALDTQLRAAGYTNNATGNITSADGHAGKQLRYVISEGGRDIVFWMSVFVTDRRVVLVEAGGDATFFEPKTKAVETAIKSLHVS